MFFIHFRNTLTILFAFSCIFLTNCGFQPIYGSNSKDSRYGVEDYLEQIHIENIPDREGQKLRNLLIDRFYRYERPHAPAYSLSLSKIQETLRDLDITKTDDTTRGQLRLDTKLRLYDKNSGKLYLERQLSAITSYNVLASEFSTRVAEDNARDNALEDLARQTELHLGLYFKRI